MNIGVLMYGYLPKIGGAQISAHNLANSLSKQGHNVTVYASASLLKQCSERGWKFNYSTRGLSIIPFRSANRGGIIGRWFGAALVARQLRKDQIETVFVVGIWPWGLLLKELKSMTGIKVAIRAAGDDIQVDESLGYGVGRNKRLRQRMLNGLATADVGIAISNTVVTEYNNTGVQLKRIEVISPGVDIQGFNDTIANRSEILARYGIPENRKIIISVGRNHKKKGYSDLLQALQILTDTGGDYHLAIVGDRTDDLIPLANDLGVAERFTAIAIIAEDPEPTSGTFPSAELIKLYKASDVFVLPSYLETYANVAVEALAAGTPAIVTDAPGCIDTIEHGVDGLIVETGNPQSIAKTIEQLFSEPGLREKLIETGLERARNQSWDEVAKRYLETMTGNAFTPNRS